LPVDTKLNVTWGCIATSNNPNKEMAIFSTTGIGKRLTLSNINT